MLRDLLSSRWFQGGFAFFALCVGGSLLYSWHVHRTTEAEFGKRPQPVVSIENKPKTNVAPVDFQTEGVVNTPDENKDTPMSDEAEALENETETLDRVDAFLPDDMVSEEVSAEDVPVSPFGFGPYPEVPEDFIQKVGAPPWLREKPSVLPEDTKKGIEILSRVLIKLWKQGDESINGGIRDSTTGLVYPYYDNTIYIRQIVQRNSNDGMAMINQVVAPPSLILSAEDMQKLQENGEAPGSIRVLDFNTAGIDPYQLLNIR